MRTLTSPRGHVRLLARVIVVTLLAALFQVVSVSPARAAAPFGDVNFVVSQGPGRVYVRGWSFDDDDLSAQVEVHLYLGPPGADYGVSLGTAQTYRPDVNAAYPGAGEYRGFDAVIDVPVSGDLEWRVYGIDPQGAANTLIESGRVTIAEVDRTPPQTTITSAPKVATPSDAITVNFSSDETDSTFECRWDAASWARCTTGTTTSLTPGEHLVEVRATDQAGNTDPTPASAVVVVSNYVSQPPLPGPEPERTLTARAVKKKSRLRIDVDPDVTSTRHRVVIQRKAGQRWRKVDRVRTRGQSHTVVVNLRRGKYRVVLPRSADGPSLRSSTVRLRR